MAYRGQVVAEEVLHIEVRAKEREANARLFDRVFSIRMPTHQYIIRYHGVVDHKSVYQRVIEELGSEPLAAYTLTFTRWRTPASRAAHANRPSITTWSLPSVVVVRRNTFSTPFRAAVHVSGFEKSPLKPAMSNLTTRLTNAVLDCF